MDDVEAGESYVVTRHRRPIARLVPVEAESVVIIPPKRSAPTTWRPEPSATPTRRPRRSSRSWPPSGDALLRGHLDRRARADGNPAGRDLFDEVTGHEDTVLVSSRLLQTELTRALRRDNVPVADREAVLANIGLAPVTEAILTSAEAITEHVKTLDAIHLATALAVGSDVVVVSHDANLKRVAEMLGLSAHDPIEDTPDG